MSTYKTVRGKEVLLGRISLAADVDGTLHIHVGNEQPHLTGQAMTLPERDASALYDLLGDVMEWESSKNMTGAEEGRMGDAADRFMESGKSDDERAAGNR